MQFFTFGFAQDDTTGSPELLGGKGAGLLWMANEGIPVPPGFIIPTSVWAEYDKKPKTIMKEIAKALPVYLDKLEAHFGYLPLLSVRSGARVSCPGMMDTILNVGIEGKNCPDWINRLGPKCFGDSFLRLVQMYGSVVNGLRKESLSGSLKLALDAYQTQTGFDFPNAKDQLLGAIEAVFKSWDNERANEYRKMHGYSREWGTAVTVQAMVFGNLNDQSGTGVLFTRNPDTGARVVTGEWLPNAQGEDIVAGIRTPLPLAKMAEWNDELYADLQATVLKLEALKRDVQDIEFTVQDGKLYLLQTRNAKRSAMAALRVAVDMVNEGLVDSKTAVKRVTARQFDLAQQASLAPGFDKDAAFQGIPACSGIVSGKPVFSKEDAIASKEPCILVTHETTPDDIAGMAKAKGVVTMVGGLTCHAAVVARAMDRACIVGVGASLEAFKDVEVLSLDGATGRIWTEAVPIVSGETNGVVKAFKTLVAASLDVVPVVFEAPTSPLPEALLYLGDQVLNPEKAVSTVLASLAQVNRLYLDLVPTAEEAQFMNIVKASNPTGRVLALLHKALPKTHEDFSRLVVIVGAEHKTAFRRLRPETDLRSLVLSDQEIVVDGLDTSDDAIAKVLAWKKHEGATIVSIGSYVAGSKSIISVPYALQLIANGEGV